MHLTRRELTFLSKRLLLLLLVAACSMRSTHDSLAQSQPQPGAEVIIAGHTVPHWEAEFGELKVTADPTGRVFAWEQDADGSVVVGARQFGEIHAFAQAGGHAYMKLASGWRRLAFNEQLSLSEPLSEAQRVDMGILAAAARAPVVTHHMAPTSARPIRLGADRRTVVTDMGPISLVTHELVSDSDGRPSSEVESSGQRVVDEPTLRTEQFNIIEESDPSCARGVSYSARAVVDGEPRQLLSRSCQRPFFFRFQGEQDANSVGILLVDIDRGETDLSGPARAHAEEPTVLRFSAALDHVQSIRLPHARFQQGEVRGTCLQSTCYLDLGSTETGWKWEKGRDSTTAERTAYALERSGERTVLGGSGWLSIRPQGGVETTIWLTDRGAASVCGVSRALDTRVLYRSGPRLYAAIRPPDRCRNLFTR